MRQVILVFAVLAVIAIGLIAFTGSGSPRIRTRPIIGVVHGPKGIIYQVNDVDYALAVSLPKDWTEQSQSNIGGASNYTANATFGQNKAGLTASVMRSSYSPAVVSINGGNYDLSQGSVFRIRAAKPVDTKTDASDGPNSAPPAPAVEVIQLPFAPLDVTPNYIEELNKYLTDRGLD
jgi:hypothetical protein